MKSVLNLKLIALMCIGLVVFSCNNDEDEPAPVNMNNNSSNPTVNVTSSDGQSWTTTTTTIFDQGYSFFAFQSQSSQGAVIEFTTQEYKGIGSFSSEEMGGAWSYKPDAQQLLSYSNIFEDEGDFGTLSILEHAKTANKLAGAFDMNLPNLNDTTDIVNIQGDFSNVPITPTADFDGTVSVSVNGEEFTSDYIMSYPAGNDILILLINDLEEVLTIKFERFFVSVYDYDMSEWSPTEVEYLNDGVSIAASSGNFSITEHEAGSVWEGIAGSTSGNFDVNLTGLGQVTGNFTVNYQ